MRITIPENFWHAGDLPARSASASVDPRRPTFQDARVDLDMRECRFIRPPAVLWSAVFPLLVVARGSSSTLLVPENVGTCLYLQSVGLFQILKDAGVRVDDRGIGSRPDLQLIVPLTRFSTEHDVERLANEAHSALQQAGMGSANLYPVVSEVFAELALNAVQHAESSVGAFGLIQFYESQAGRRFICAVADGGIGIRRSLERNPALVDKVAYDWDAVELSLEEGISGTGARTRGIGLFGVAEDMRKPGRQLIIHSGIGMLQINDTVQGDPQRTTLFPGTLVAATIAT
ncbi:MAG: hypothetical protein HY271_01315 [Deltaproteobacteria bacterium]|nr:hypothetical protein [Deltaproteobacteria bacterium]